MKTIRLIRLSIENFKRIPHLELDFDGTDWTIYGRNAAGKTSIYDAFYWLLFDKDSHGAKDFDVEPRNADGTVKNPEAVTIVNAVLDCDGAMYCFEKHYYQKWQQQRGSAEKSYTGNTAEYYIDGVPLKKSEYEASVKAIVHEDLFKLLTNLTAFTSLHWTEQRSILFDMCDIGDDLTLMGTDERFAELAEDIGRRSFTDYRKYLEAQRKTIVSAKNAVPPRIDENIRTINEYGNIDSASANAELAQLSEQAAKLRAEISELGSDKAVAELNISLARIDNERRALMLENDEYRSKQRNTDSAAEKLRLESEKNMLATSLRAAEADLNHAAYIADGKEKRLSELRERYKAESEAEFNGLKPCPTCGRPYDDKDIKKAMDAFDAHKAEILGNIAADGMTLGAEVEEAKKKVAECEKRRDEAKSALDKAIAAYEGYTVETPVISDMPDYDSKMADTYKRETDTKNEIDRLARERDSIRAELRQRISDIEVKMRGLSAVVSRAALAEAAKERVEELRAEERRLADQINKTDKLLSLCADFTRYKVGFVQDSINSRFRITKFKLFNEQKNGGLEECCEATHNGIGFNRSLNDGARVNVSLDIITALSAYHGVSVPLFIDNAERVTGLLETNTQTIKLMVSAEDEELRCVENGITCEEESEVNRTAAGC